ncbi:MAG TPA: BON domain-containing protein [Burkholderiales bacterium]|jgi:osmotically-inducible protein OsmY|nr:BON domain-containing protein [Burkholderiales bacterium]
MAIQAISPSGSRARWVALLAAILLAAALAGCAGAGVKSGQYIDDSAITTKVKAQLAGDETVSALDVHVETVEGAVRLSGFVSNPDEKRRAEQLAWSVDGVQFVQNALVVQNP